ncbi:MAG: hypothetical protein ACOYK8_07330 [Alphaproteobacteria bacterium]
MQRCVSRYVIFHRSADFDFCQPALIADFNTRAAAMIASQVGAASDGVYDVHAVACDLNRAAYPHIATMDEIALLATTLPGDVGIFTVPPSPPSLSLMDRFQQAGGTALWQLHEAHWQNRVANDAPDCLQPTIKKADAVLAFSALTERKALELLDNSAEEKVFLLPSPLWGEMKLAAPKRHERGKLRLLTLVEHDFQLADLQILQEGITRFAEATETEIIHQLLLAEHLQQHELVEKLKYTGSSWVKLKDLTLSTAEKADALTWMDAIFIPGYGGNDYQQQQLAFVKIQEMVVLSLHEGKPALAVGNVLQGQLPAACAIELSPYMEVQPTAWQVLAELITKAKAEWEGKIKQGQEHIVVKHQPDYLALQMSHGIIPFVSKPPHGGAGQSFKP